MGLLDASLMPKPLGTTQGVGVERPSSNTPTLQSNGSTTWESNPWAGMAERDHDPPPTTNLDTANNAASQIPSLMNGLSDKMNSLQSQLSAYPTFPNPSGIGSQNYGQAQPDSASRGFNPWSLMGEANSR